MKIICTKCGLVHNNRATEHLKDRLCCYNTVRMVNYEIDEKVKAEYAKLFPLPCSCGCGSKIVNREPDKLCCRFALIYAANGITDKAEYEVEKDNRREAEEKGIKPTFKSLTSLKDMEIIFKMARGEAVKMEKKTVYGLNVYTVTLDCAKVEFHKSLLRKGFFAWLEPVNGWRDVYYECRAMKEHAQHIGRKLSCMFTN